MRAAPYLPGSYLVLETTNRCSLACGHCTVSEPGHPHHARTGMVSLALVEKLFADLVAARARFDVFLPFWLGEPLIHPEFGPIHAAALRVAVEHGTFGRVEVHTNATHLTEDRVRLALNAAPVPQTWHLTLDADTSETYRHLKGREGFEAVVANVEAFLEAKARTGARWPRPVLQYILCDRNAHEAPAFRARWEGVMRRYGLSCITAAQEVPAGEDPVLFYRQLDAPTPEEQVRQNRVYRDVLSRMGVLLPREERSTATLPPGNGAVCGCFWKSPVVGWDGRLTTCTRDNRLENALGNLHDSSFAELWWGEEMRGRRGRVARADYAGLAPCTSCFIPRSANYSGVTPAEVEAYR